jgi:DivIVA domain-containing protein
MPLSPEEIETKHFVTILRGYDPEEVEAFLRRIGAEMRQLLQALYAALPPEGAGDPTDVSLESLLNHGGQVSAEVQRLVENGRVAQLDAEGLVRAAKEEAAELHAAATQFRIKAVRDSLGTLDLARKEAATIVAGAEARKRGVEAEINAVERQLEQAAKMLDALRRQLAKAAPSYSPPSATSKVDG